MQNIKTIQDVISLFQSLVDSKTIFHPDDDFTQYTNEKGKLPWSKKRGKELNIQMGECFEVCKAVGIDIYKLGMCVSKVMGPEGEVYARKCDVTGLGMNDGWVFGIENFYCCTKELADLKAQEMGCKDFNDLYEDGGENYWTEWDIDDDAQYIIKNGELVDIEE